MPIPLIIIGAILLLLASLFLLRIRILLLMRDGVRAELRVLCFKFRLYPKRKKIKLRHYSKKRLAARAERDKKKKQKRKQQHEGEKKESEPKRTLRENLRLLRGISRVLIHRTHKHLHLHAARLHIRVATGDAATTAVAYGVVSQSVAYLLAGLDKVTNLKAVPPDVAVHADFQGERSAADVKLVFSIRLWGALLTLLSLAISYFSNKRGLKRARRKKNITHTKGT